MMSLWSSIGLVLASSLVLEASANELLVRASVAPKAPGIAAPEPDVTSKNLQLEQVSPERWSYKLSDEKSVYGIARIEVKDPPQSYEFVPLEIVASTDYSDNISVAAIAVQVLDTNQEIVDIYSTSAVKDIDLPGLFQLYQRAAILSGKRLTSLENGGRLLSVRDVQLFFKLLESARELGWSANLAPSDIVLNVSGFLRKRLRVDRDRNVMERSIQSGIGDVELLLAQIDSIGAEHLKQIWGQIQARDTKERGSPEACMRYSAFRETLLYKTDKLRREAWDKNYRFTELVSDAVSLCATRRAEELRAKGKVDAEAAAKILADFGPVKLDAVAVVPSSAAGKALIKHNNVIRALRIPF